MHDTLKKILEQYPEPYNEVRLSPTEIWDEVSDLIEKWHHVIGTDMEEWIIYYTSWEQKKYEIKLEAIKNSVWSTDDQGNMKDIIDYNEHYEPLSYIVTEEWESEPLFGSESYQECKEWIAEQ